MSKHPAAILLAASVLAAGLPGGAALAEPVFPQRDMTEVPFQRPQDAVQKALQAFINSVARGMPDYRAMTPELAMQVEGQLPVLQSKVMNWGRLRSIRQFQANPKTAPVYVATFEHKRVVWSVAPLAGHKLAAFAYSEVS